MTTGLDKMILAIEEQAQTEADAILDEARAEAAEIVKARLEAANQRCAQIQRQAEQTAEALRRREEHGASLRERQALLEAKQQLLADTLNQAKQAVLGLPIDDYFALLGRMAQRVTLSGTANLHMNIRDTAHISDAFLAAFPTALQVTVAEPVEIAGGFLLQAGEITVDCSVNALFEQYKEQLADTAASVLFT